MIFNSLMHVSFYTDHYDEMIDFYVNKLGLKQHVIVRWKEYKGRTDRRVRKRQRKTRKVFSTPILNLRRDSSLRSSRPGKIRSRMPAGMNMWDFHILP